MKFSIRDLFWLTIVVAMGVAWWMDRVRMREEIKREVEHVYSVLENRAASLNPPKK